MPRNKLTDRPLIAHADLPTDDLPMALKPGLTIIQRWTTRVCPWLRVLR